MFSSDRLVLCPSDPSGLCVLQVEAAFEASAQSNWRPQHAISPLATVLLAGSHAG